MEDPKQTFNIHYRNMSAEFRTLTPNTQEFSFENVASANGMPARLAIFFVPASFRTEYINNPFQLCRNMYEMGEGTNEKNTNKHRTRTLKCYLKEISVRLNGDAYDSTFDHASEQDDLRQYVNFIKSNGCFGRQVTNSISYEEFMDSSYVAYYDFTCNTKGYEKLMVPCVIQAEMKIRVAFSAALPYEVKMYMVSEYPSTLVVDNKLNVTVTHPY
jgi:hypothetical protein